MTREGIYEFIARQRTSLISSVDEEGYPATRALIQPVLVDGNDIYFATYTSSRKVRHYRNNPKACVYVGGAKERISAKQLFELMKIELWNIRDQCGHRYDGAIQQYLDALEEYVNTHGLPQP